MQQNMLGIPAKGLAESCRISLGKHSCNFCLLQLMLFATCQVLTGTEIMANEDELLNAYESPQNQHENGTFGTLEYL